MPRNRNVSRQTLLVLVALETDLGSWRHGLSISRETGLSSGTLYPLLRRLHEQGYVEAEWREPEERGRPPRHVYRLTLNGVALARERISAALSPANARLRPA